MDNNSQSVRYENERLLLKDNYLILKGSETAARLSKNQKTLIFCLLNNIIEKERIIQQVWKGSDSHTKEKNYNQLVFQTRALLTRQGFPENLIMTIHRYGLCFNKFFLSSPDDQGSMKTPYTKTFYP